ncbi:asparaginase [Calidifontibacter sp. DB0510]|uniref:Asparaginase n=1 Tax=Metallococcus carri TaxID=1656884 RepID=A0A967B1E7_9MICO|nr:asparaginase [Metallococcus carri]NHN55510.1 asparaginase [Metallococcus carri]NOP38306.1 asparaginase [Calidifontibacter sp. DB2511S]
MTASSQALSEAPVLAYVDRGGFVESVHRAVAVVVDADGVVQRAWGEATAPCFPRSSNKPLQAVAMLRSGLRLEGPQLALAAASHSGEGFHLEGVQAMLADAGLTVADLQNTPDLPYDEQARRAWLAAGHGPESLAQNCSGKHAAMLATCLAAGWDPATYRDPQHPLQRAMADTLSELAGEPIAATAVDGCGAPVMALSPVGLGRAFARLATAPAGTPERTVRDAIREHPEFLGGTRRDVTALIRGVDGLIAKDGAEAVYAVGLADGRGVVVKVADGGQRARPVILAAVLRAIGVDAPVLDQLLDAPVLGHGEPVGAVRPVNI